MLHRWSAFNMKSAAENCVSIKHCYFTLFLKSCHYFKVSICLFKVVLFFVWYTENWINLSHWKCTWSDTECMKASKTRSSIESLNYFYACCRKNLAEGLEQNRRKQNLKPNCCSKRQFFSGSSRGGDFGGQRETVLSKIWGAGDGDVLIPQYFVSCHRFSTLSTLLGFGFGRVEGSTSV